LVSFSVDCHLDDDVLVNANCAQRDTVDECTSVNESECNSEEEYTDEDEDGYSSSEEDKTSQIVRSILNRDFGPALDANKQRIIERTLTSLAYVLPTTPTSVRSCAGTDSSSGSQKGGVDNKSIRSPPGGGLRRERSGNNWRKSEGGRDDDEGNEPLRKDLAHSVSLSTGPKLACPFFKRDPDKYSQFRTCVGPGWDTVHRLKYVAQSYSAQNLPLTQQ
jgi:hypothetical protein